METPVPERAPLTTHEQTMLDQQLLSKLKGNTHSTEEGTLLLVEDLLTRGANPNALSRTPHDFKCALGVAVGKGYPSVVEALLRAGAAVAWPEEASISPHDLVGRENDNDEVDVGYRGGPVDPFMLALDGLAWAISEYDENDRASLKQRAKANAFTEIAHCLLEAGVDPEKEDPANWRQPFSHLMITLIENLDEDAFPDFGLKLVGDLYFQVIDRRPDTAEIVTRIAEGDDEALPQCAWSSHEELPQLFDYMRDRCQHRLLEEATPQSPGRRSGPLRL